MNRNFSIVALAGIAAGAAAAPTFLAPFTLASAQRPAGVAAADFNGDGHIDLAIATDTPDKISVYINNGAGGFNAPVNYLTGTQSGPDAVKASDVDGDGDADLVVVLKGTNQVRIYTNTAGVFAAGQTIATGAEPVDLAMGDINGDGTTDFITTNRDASTITMLTNVGGVLSASSMNVGADPRVTVIADFDGDGDADLAVSAHDDRRVEIYRNGGTGAFTPAFTLTPNFNNRPGGLLAADFNGDGQPDLATTAGNFVSVWLNTGGAFGAPAAVATGGVSPGELAAADFDADGALDLVCTNEDSSSISVFAGTGTGSFGAAQVLATGATPSRLALADLDGNGSSDIAVTNRDSNTTSIFLNDQAVVEPCDADLNNDGQLDFFDIAAFLNAVSSGDLATADLNNDGVADFFDVLAYLNLFSQGCP